MLPEILAGVLLASLILYVLTAGADFGGGVWDLFATGRRAAQQRKVIDEALAPVWEANHVWLILALVILFTAFPPAYSAVSTALHVPLTLMLLGVVLRGSAFVFRKYGLGSGRGARRWGRVFAVSSLLTPIAIGITVGALAGGAIRLDDGLPMGAFLFAWWAPFPLAVGLFTLGLFAFLAAVYLTCETTEATLQDDFRRRALVSGLALAPLAFVTALTAGPTTTTFATRLLHSWWSAPLQLVTAVAALGALTALVRRSYRAARLLAAAQVGLIVIGWGAAQYPYLMIPDLTIRQAAAPQATLALLGPTLLVGAVVLFPALYWLFRVFKAQPRK